MSSVAAFFVFVLVMLALATLAIILDWMGKPIRRSFRPRTTGTPGWLMVDAPPPAPAGAGEPPVGPSAMFSEQPDFHQPEGPVAAGASALNPGPPQEAPPATGPWQAGDSIFKLTPQGTLPSITAVRRRYWKNLSERRASTVFGEANRELMAIGQAPQRFNPRTGAAEELSLPEPMLRQCWKANRKPTPTWGDRGLDPFARP